MKYNAMKHRKYVVTGVLLAGTAATSFAQFGLPTIVFDPKSYVQAIAQAKTLYSQLNTIQNNLIHFSAKQLWRTSLNRVKTANVANLLGETNGMVPALNTNSPTAALMAWNSAAPRMNSVTNSYLGGQLPGSAKLSQLAFIETSDSSSPDCLNAVGAYRAARNSDAAAEAALQQQQLDSSSATNTEIEQLNLLNASQAQHMVELQSQGVLHACLASQMAIANMQQRNAAAEDLNLWAEVHQQQTTNPAYIGNSSGTWTTYLP